MGPDIIIPVILFLVPVAIVWLFQHFALRKRIEAFQTLRFAIEKGQTITPETLESMARMSSPIADLRRGIVFVAISLGIAAFAGILAGNRSGDEWPEVMRGLIGVAMLPLFVGSAFLGIHFFANESKRRQG